MALSGVNTPDQNETGSDGNEGIPYILQASLKPTVRLINVISGTIFGEGSLPLYRDAVSVFYCPSRLGSLAKSKILAVVVVVIII